MNAIERARERVRRRGLIPGCVKWGHGHGGRLIINPRGRESLEYLRQAIRDGDRKFPGQTLIFARGQIDRNRELRARWYDMGGRLP